MVVVGYWWWWWRSGGGGGGGESVCKGGEGGTHTTPKLTNKYLM